MKTNNKKPANNLVPKKPTSIVAIGHIDIELIFNLTDELLARHKAEWDNITSASDLELLNKDGDLLNYITLESNNNLVNTLLYLNKTSVEKFRIEFITLNELLKILKKDEEKFLSTIFKNVTESNNLFFDEKEITPETKSKLIITLKNNNNIKSFQLKIENDKIEGESVEPIPPTTIVRQPPRDDIFTKINFDFKSFDYLFLDLEDFLTISPEHSVDILQYFLKYLESIISENEKIKIMLSYSNVMNHTKSLNLKTVELIINIFSISDILISERKDLHSLFNLIYQIKESEGAEGIKHLPQRDLMTYISKSISFTRKHSKTCLVLDDFQKFSILELSPNNKKKIILERTKELHLYPKINHTNQKLIEEYRNILSGNYTFYRSVFFGGFLSKYINLKISLEDLRNSNHGDKNENIRTYYSSYLQGKGMTKKLLESAKNETAIPTDIDFYLVKISQTRLDQEIEKENLKLKEEKFLLDCNNQRSSRLKYYHPLCDENMNLYFSSEINRRQLKEKGFINTNGFIMYDGFYRDVMGPNPKRKNEVERDHKKQNAHKSINAGENSKDIMNSISPSKILVSSNPTDKKLPVFKFEYLQVNPPKLGKLKLKPIKKIKLLGVNSSSIAKGKITDGGKIKPVTKVDPVNHENEKNKSHLNLYSHKDNFPTKGDEMIADDSLKMDTEN